MPDTQPWMKFYPRDWRGDQALRVCSLAARGLWIEMLCVMHEADPYGHLLVNGHPVTDTQLASLCGVSPDQLSALLIELENAGAYSKTRNGVIYSRRMTRDAKKAKTARENGKDGGNPSLSKQSGISPSVNPSDKPPDKTGVKAQIPDTRYQIPDSSLRSKRARADDDFQRWWAEQPNKVGKPAALKSYRRARKTASEGELLTGLRRYVATKPPDRQWLNPTTFLNQERWKDQPAHVNNDAKRTRTAIDGDAFTAGLAASLGVRSMGTERTPSAGNESGVIDGDFSVVGDDAPSRSETVRKGDDGIARLRCHVQTAMPGAGKARSDLPRNARPSAGRPAAHSDRPHQARLELGQPDAVPSRHSRVREQRIEPTPTTTDDGTDRDTESSGRGAEERYHAGADGSAHGQAASPVPVQAMEGGRTDDDGLDIPEFLKHHKPAA